MKNSEHSSSDTPERAQSSQAAFNDMRLLDEVAQTPHATQRDLARRIGIALGLTNLMLRRLAKKGFIKISNVKKSRVRYLVTPQGMMEKARLTREYIEYSLSFYKNIRTFLKDHLNRLVHEGNRRILICGTGELAEITFLTMQEMGLELVGVVDEGGVQKRFMEHNVRSIGYTALIDFDRIIVTSVRIQPVMEALRRLHIPNKKILMLSRERGGSVLHPESSASVEETFRVRPSVENTLAPVGDN